MCGKRVASVVVVAGMFSLREMRDNSAVAYIMLLREFMLCHE
jgi:hypothetical protein